MFEEAWYVGHGGWRCNVWRATEHVWPISRRIWQRRWCLAGRQTGWWWWHLAMRHQQWRVRTQHAVDKRVTHPTTNRAMRFDLALKNRRCCQLSLLKGNASNLWSEVSMLNDCYCNDYLTQNADIICIMFEYNVACPGRMRNYCNYYWKQIGSSMNGIGVFVNRLRTYIHIYIYLLFLDLKKFYKYRRTVHVSAL